MTISANRPRFGSASDDIHSPPWAWVRWRVSRSVRCSCERSRGCSAPSHSSADSCPRARHCSHVSPQTQCARWDPYTETHDEHSPRRQSFAHRWLLTASQNMLYTIAIVLLILWLLGLVSSYTVSGFIHILLVVAIVLILVRVISGRKIA